MKRETKIMIILYLLLVVAIVVPFIPYPQYIYYTFPEARPLTIVEYIRLLLINMVIK